ncbi:hypothetical protein [Paenibacillus humicola]|uniref:hypothetical protein n=1 Tax=Paenibacillus humicola TaxID=3110540 RepID=UPI00237C310A|nr:hypothetical protein [Paenibacillus humicola]
MRKRAAVRALAVCLAVAAAVGTSGCNYKRWSQNSTFDYGSQQKRDPKTMGARMYGTMSGIPGQHDNAWFEYSSQLSTDVYDLPGVASALVFLTDKNAYVGITLDHTAVGTKRTGGPGTREQDNTGTTEGVYNNDTGSPYWNNQRIATPYNSNLTVNDHNQLSGELKQTIATTIRRLAPVVQEVHISANMEFLNHLVQYQQEARLGHSLTPWLDSFNTLVKHQFAGGDFVPEPLDVQKRKAIRRIGDTP